MMANITELRQKSEKELLASLLELMQERFNLRMQLGSGAVVKTHRFKQIRQSIARIKTLLNEAKSRG